MTAHAPRGARGVLYPGLAPGRFRHDQQPPSADLAPWVEHHWFVSWDLRGCPPQVQSTLPHPNVHLVVEDGAVRLWGVQRARFNRTLAGRGWVHGVKFKVGALPAFMRSPATDLMDRQVDARGLLGDDVDRLLDPPLADAPEAGKTRIEAVLRARVPPVVDAPLHWLGVVFGPLALLLVGASLASIRLGRAWRAGLELALVKNVVHPVLVAFISSWLAIGSLERSVMVLSAALPIGANVFLFSQRYGVAQEEVTAGVAVSTLLAVPSVALVLMLLS